MVSCINMFFNQHPTQHTVLPLITLLCGVVLSVYQGVRKTEEFSFKKTHKKKHTEHQNNVFSGLIETTSSEHFLPLKTFLKGQPTLK